MKDELIKFETAKLAREKGFITFINNWTNLYIAATEELISRSQLIGDKYYYISSTQSLLQRWLREKYQIYCSAEVFRDLDGEDRFESCIDWAHFVEGDFGEEHLSENCFDTYEEALEDALVAGLKLVK